MFLFAGFIGFTMLQLTIIRTTTQACFAYMPVPILLV